MMNQSNYEASYGKRSGARPVSWEDFQAYCRGLALSAEKFDPQIIIGNARGGVYPGAQIAHLLRKDFYTVYLTRRRLDRQVSEQPVWLVRPPDLVRGQRVLVVDEISSTGETLRMLKAELARLGAGEVRCAVLYAHTSGVETPDYIGLISDALLINPWDREIVQDGLILYHPEYLHALSLQDIPPGSVLPQVMVTTYPPDKVP